ncbi:hypothetical protein C4577_01925 [Candidatus Parcubacteria bacterium]|nr:MAG: hypothetical protein C4577_01925 [Candidatus Parcubacteria bacterium]
MIVVGPGYGYLDSIPELEEKWKQETSKIADFILLCLNQGPSKGLKRNDILDLYEIECEDRGMTRTQRRDAVDSFAYRFADAVWKLHREYKIEWSPDHIFFLRKK